MQQEKTAFKGGKNVDQTGKGPSHEAVSEVHTEGDDESGLGGHCLMSLAGEQGATAEWERTGDLLKDQPWIHLGWKSAGTCSGDIR